ncbi:GPI mannosyltransferase 2 [Mortierella sp. GBAus27b]|nr:GPI mannosyltransferase 2 [Mortierella sp. GBAus27b]
MAPGADRSTALEDYHKDRTVRTSTIAYYALLSRLAIWALAVASHALIQDYDSSLELVLPIETPPQQLFKGVFGVFLRWDSFYFTHTAKNGYVFEQAHAFFPLLSAMMRFAADTVLALLGGQLSFDQRLVLAGVLIANASFIIASIQLYRLTIVLFGREQFAFLSALLYILTPSGIFMSAIYAESLFAALSFTGMLFAARKQYLLAAITWSISCTARSNGILYAGFFIYDLIIRMDLRSSIMGKIWTIIKAGCLSLICWTGFLAVQGYGYSLYCSTDSILERRPWCDSVPPSIYTFVQDFYWNVGFLRYYEIKQIPNFLMAAPMVTLSASGIFYYVMYDRKRMLSLGRQSGTVSQDSPTPPFLSLATLPYVVLWSVFLFTAVTTMHIQVITRTFSCLPPVYWFAGHQFDEKGALGSGWRWTVSTYFVMYGLVGVVLFANFFPPA